MPFPIDHDMHCHSCLSSCSSDPAQSAQAILDHAKAHGYTLQCITDHLWDNLVPGASGWYAPQDVEHVKKNLPLPKDDQVRMVFGCETEFLGGSRLGLDPRHYDDFDFIVIPPNHFHMKNFVRPDTYDTEEKIADLFVRRLEEISNLDLPWRKVGIAHMVCGLIFKEGDQYRVYELIDEARFRAVMRKFARLGAGIEINLSSFWPDWKAHEDAMLRLYRLAKEEGCKFYLASDAHHPRELELVPGLAPGVVEALGLTEADRFILE
ncbi:MAG: hypothetical protein IKS52_06945 [Clostridia bacterium]|nr:hypothetical protein [Clostridia bacterium]MBO4884023.1 hypothetical protein [Clostridia bacterium]MBR4442990.1 hypothetical protein [Clostridia bacterium]